MLRRQFKLIEKKIKYIQKEEDQVRKTIRKKITDFLKSKKSPKVTSMLNVFNPLTAHLYYKISFKVLARAASYFVNRTVLGGESSQPEYLGER